MAGVGIGEARTASAGKAEVRIAGAHIHVSQRYTGSRARASQSRGMASTLHGARLASGKCVGVYCSPLCKALFREYWREMNMTARRA
jgi:hypothetical protein